MMKERHMPVTMASKYKDLDKSASLDNVEWNIEVAKKGRRKWYGWMKMLAVLMVTVVVLSLIVLLVSGVIFRFDVLRMTKFQPDIGLEYISRPLLTEHMETANFYFATKLSENSNKNTVWSPFVASVNLALLLEGAKDLTAFEIQSSMHWTHLTLPQIRFHLSQIISTLNVNAEEAKVANGMFVQKQSYVTTEYSNVLEDKYNADIIRVDFNSENETRNTINSWGIKESGGHIKEIIKPGLIDSRTSAILSSLLTFRGKWQFPFPAEHTQKAKFFATRGRQVEVDMMYMTRKFMYKDFVHHRFSVLELPYMVPHASMFILLGENLSDLKNMLSEENGRILIDLRSKMRNVTVDVCLPKFKIETNMQLEDRLKTMGIHNLFDPATSDLSGISSDKSLHIQKIFHRVLIEVNEKGTEGDAASSSIVGSRSLVENFCANRPFIFYVQDLKYQNILFWGEFHGPDN